MDIHKIITEWNFRVRQIKDIDVAETVSYGNVNLAIDRFTSLAFFLRTYLPILQEWTVSYLDENRAAIFTRYYREHINNWALNHIDRYTILLHPAAVNEWNTAFPSIPFEEADQLLKEIVKKREITECDIPEIATMHDGIEHDNDAWWGCDWCTTQEHKWLNELRRRIKVAPHPLLNMSLPLPEPILSVWEPPHTWSYGEAKWLTLNAYKDVIKKIRATTPTRGKTPIQAIRGVMPFMFKYGGWQLDEFRFIQKDPYLLFMQLWNTLDLVSYTIFLDIPTLMSLHVEYRG